MCVNGFSADHTAPPAVHIQRTNSHLEELLDPLADHGPSLAAVGCKRPRPAVVFRVRGELLPILALEAAEAALPQRLRLDDVAVEVEVGLCDGGGRVRGARQVGAVDG